jgi:hypothetical protein
MGPAVADQSVSHSDVPSPSNGSEAAAVKRWSLLVTVALLSGLAVWLVSPRFVLDTPSLVDDWSAISRSANQLSEIARLANPEEQRFRPGWIVWNYLQWHTLDAPGGRLGVNVWNTARIVVFVAGLCLLTALLLPRPRSRREAALHAALAGIPALLVITAPKFAVDFARFGPQEPMLVGGMALGGSLLAIVARMLLEPTRPFPRWRTTIAAVAGIVFWTLGTYQKETSLAALPLIVAALFAGRSRLANWRRLSSGRRVALGGLATLAALPLVHVAVESMRIIRRGALVYGAEVDAGRGAARGFQDLYQWASEALLLNWRLCVLAAVLLTVVVTVMRRRIDILALGAIASGALALLFAGQSGVVATRYFIPAVALVLVALPVSLARFPFVVQLLGLLVILVVFMPPTRAKEEVRLWTEPELEEASLVRAIADLHSSGCTVAVAGLDEEAGVALPVVVEAKLRPEQEVCGAVAYLAAGTSEEGAALLAACAPDAQELLLRTGESGSLYEWGLYRCKRLGDEPVQDPTLGLVEPEALIASRQLKLSGDG